MIPSDHILFNSDGTAWLVDAETETSTTRIDLYRHLDRPCDTCGGDGIDGSHEAALYYADQDRISTCPDCSGTGRHTFTVEVETFTVFDASDGERGIRYELRTLRVSVVPGMVLPIVDEYRVLPNSTVIRQHADGWMVDDPEGERQWVTLPPAAAPDMWCVKLAVQS